MMRRLSAVCGLLSVVVAALAATAADVAVPLQWDVERTRPAQIRLESRRGETLLHTFRFTDLGISADLSGATNVWYNYRPAGATSVYCVAGWILNATNGQVGVRWTSAHELTNTVYSWDLTVSGATSAMCRAFGTHTIAATVGYQAPTGTPSAITQIDFATAQLLNVGSAPFLTVSGDEPLWSSSSNRVVYQGGTASVSVLHVGGTNLIDILAGISLTPGPAGSNGTSGTAATIAIAGVTTLQAGADAWVTNVGSSNAASWMIGIPRGADGISGAAGTSATITVVSTLTLAESQSAYITNVGTAQDARWIIGIPRGPTGMTGPAGTATNGFTFNLVQSTQWLATVEGGTNLILTIDTNASGSASSSVSASHPLTATTNGGVVTVGLTAATFQGATWPKALWANSTTGSYYWSDIVPGTNNINIAQMTNMVVFGGLSSTNDPLQNQTWTCPVGVTNVFIQLWGGGGGGGGGSGSPVGGAGGYTYITVPLVSGNNYTIRVGKGGPVATPNSGYATKGLPGGGRGYSGNTLATAGSGGGYSAFLDGTNILAVAAGGGGGAYSGSGGAGGGATGASGTANAGTAGTGGGQTLGGVTNGAYLSGGDPVAVGSNPAYGAGGGGWYGGGAAFGSGTLAGGGGGSCFVANPAWGSYQRGNATGAADYTAPWGSGGGATAAGSDGAIVIRYGVGL